MIGRLALAQLRAHRAQTAWLAALLTVLAGIVTYLMVVGATQATLSTAQWDITDGSGERGAWIPIYVGEAPAEWSGLSPTGLADALAEASHGTAAASETLLLSQPNELGGWDERDQLRAYAFSRSAQAEAVLVDGDLPTARGEIAVPQGFGGDTVVKIGDTLTLHVPIWGADAAPRSRALDYTVVGIIDSPSLPGFDMWGMPGAIVSWEEAIEPGGALMQPLDADGGAQAYATQVNAKWDGSSATLDPFVAWGDGRRSDPGVAMPMSTAPWLGAAVTLAAAMVVMSFAVGRSQAAARTQWVATTRTLGASRRYVATASIVETAIIATGSLAGGLALGTLGAQAQLTAARSLVPHPFGTATISWHPTIVPTVAAVLAIVAIVISAVPAFWASRVAPAAALKPVNDVTEAELSRRVRARWLWIPFAASCFAIGWAYAHPIDDYPLLQVLGSIGAAVTGVALVVEWARLWIPAAGRRLARSQHGWLMSAGDALRLRPRQAVAPALIAATGAGVLTVVSVSGASNIALAITSPDVWETPVRTTIQWAVEDVFNAGFRSSAIVVALATQLVVAAIAVSHRSAVTREAGVLRAIGLSRRDEVRATWWQQWLPQVVGLAIGVTTAEALELSLGFLESHPSDNAALLLRCAIGLVPVLGIVAVYLALAAAVAWVLARSTTRATPVAALRPPS